MGFTTKESMVRVDIFKESGKWYDTVELCTAGGYFDHNTRDAVKNAFILQYPTSYKGMTAVCLKPYHQYSHPVMWRIEQ